MGVLNVTPDSFSDGGKYNSITSALKHCEQMLYEGADIVDIGGQSSRPGAKRITAIEEKSRVLPIIKAIKNTFPKVKLSLDSFSEDVINNALDLGIDIINDIYALRNITNYEKLVRYNVGVVLMHMQGDPSDMQEQPSYENVVVTVTNFLKNRINIALNNGIKKENIMLDPGFGFGKILQHNIELLTNLQELNILECPIVVGISRKSMLGEITGKSVKDRTYAGIAATTIACMYGASLIRTHDVAATCDAVKVYNKVVQTEMEIKSDEV